MKKLLFAMLVVILAGAAVVAPKVIGNNYQQQLHNIVNEINKNPAYKLAIISTDKRWFSQDSELQLQLVLGTYGHTQLPQLTTDIHVHSKFGPLLFVESAFIGWSYSEVQISAGKLRQWLQWDETSPLYQMTLVNTLGNTVSIKETVPALTFHLPDSDAVINFSGYQSHASCQADHLRYQGKVAKVVVSSTQEAALNGTANELLVNANLQGDLATLISRRFYNGKFSMTLASITSIPATLKALELTAVTKVDEQNDTGDTTVKYALGEITLPDYKASDLQLTLEVNHISQAVMQEYQEFAHELFSQDYSEKEQANQLLLFIAQKAPELLAKQPEINITDISGRLPEGKFSGVLKSTVEDVANVTFQDLTHQQFWLKHLKADSQVSMDEGVAKEFSKWVLTEQLAKNPSVMAASAAERQQFLDEKSAQILQQLAAAGFIVKQGNGYGSQVSLQQGIANINGKSLPLVP
ncbi:DUF945 family protein [Shewanella sp. A32]|uniref:YdgA family protein n=1 Tax=Shewanella sp. A32 TaxID=3031327 RepID=UPI0023B8DA40|nr:DUF945 family protein [Shewanella sp. A32]MDF0534966.1 DUF945 family protein [Shewanella sp. A32]